MFITASHISHIQSEISQFALKHVTDVTDVTDLTDLTQLTVLTVLTKKRLDLDQKHQSETYSYTVIIDQPVSYTEKPG